MQSIDKALEEYAKLDKAVRDRYDLRLSELMELKNGQGVLDMISNAFSYGFIKGMRYQKTQNKREYKHEVN